MDKDFIVPNSSASWNPDDYGVFGDSWPGCPISISTPTNANIFDYAFPLNTRIEPPDHKTALLVAAVMLITLAGLLAALIRPIMKWIDR
jgi:hypothetical protein